MLKDSSRVFIPAIIIKLERRPEFEITWSRTKIMVSKISVLARKPRKRLKRELTLFATNRGKII